MRKRGRTLQGEEPLMGVINENITVAERQAKVLDLMGAITEAAISYADHVENEEQDQKWNEGHPSNQRSTVRDRTHAREKLQEIRKLVRELHNL